MNNYLKKVFIFHKVYNHPIESEVGKETLETRQLRIKLLFEELEELAVATGTDSTFVDLCIEGMSAKSNLGFKGDHNNVDHVEELDALCDLQVVLSGKILTSGHYKHFDKAFEEVHKSNMSKICKSSLEAEITVIKYLKEKIRAYTEKINEHWIIKRSKDDKILKGVDFKEPELEQFIK